jgi:sugar transferase (PEP-CTERM/EpsH1 system associated)
VNDFATADRRPRVLYVTHRVPFPPDKGDRIRNYHVLRQIAAGADVYLAAVADEPVSGATRAELARYCRAVELVPAAGPVRWVRAAGSLLAGRSLSEGAFANPALVRVLARWAAEVRFEAAVVSASSLAPLLRRFGLARVPGFVDVVDVDSQKWFDYATAASGPRRWLYQLEGSRVRDLERSLPDWAAACTLVSRPEADLFDAIAGAGSATVATNGVDLDYFQPLAVGEEPACAFVGALDYRPNVDAAAWFATDVWPLVRAERPEAEFRLIGRKPAPAVERLAAIPGVRVIGQVPDVRPYVASAAVVVAPMRLGRGLQNKVLEALAMRKAVVASPPAIAALAVEPGVHLERAETPDEWASTVRRLLVDPTARKFLGDSGFDYVRQHHDWGMCLRPLTELLRAAAEPATAGHS